MYYIIPDYLGPSPPPFSGEHRFQYFLFRQPPSFQPDSLTEVKGRERKEFRFQKFIKQKGLCEAFIAGYQFMSKSPVQKSKEDIEKEKKEKEEMEKKKQSGGAGKPGSGGSSKPGSGGTGKSGSGAGSPPSGSKSQGGSPRGSHPQGGSQSPPGAESGDPQGQGMCPAPATPGGQQPPPKPSASGHGKQHTGQRSKVKGKPRSSGPAPRGNPSHDRARKSQTVHSGPPMSSGPRGGRGSPPAARGQREGEPLVIPPDGGPGHRKTGRDEL